MIDEEKAKAEEAAQEELEQKLERLEGNLGNIRFVCLLVVFHCLLPFCYCLFVVAFLLLTLFVARTIAGETRRQPWQHQVCLSVGCSCLFVAFFVGFFCICLLL